MQAELFPSEKPPSKPKKKRKIHSDLLKRVTLTWNQQTEFNGLSKVRFLGEVRRKKLIARLHDLDWPMPTGACGLEEEARSYGLDPQHTTCWELSLYKVRDIDWMVGKTDRGWRMTFDWWIGSTTNAVERILEHNTKPAQQFEQHKSQGRKPTEEKPF